VTKVFVDSTDYCEESMLDAQKLINIIKSSNPSNNYVFTKNIHQADLIFYNACGHLDCKEKQSLNDIETLRKLKNPKSRLIIWGCLPKINPASLKDVYKGPLIGPEDCWDFFHNHFSLPKEKNFDVNANTINKHNIPQQIENRQKSLTEKFTQFYASFEDQRDKFFNFRKRLTTKNMWYIKIVHGCKNSCTYCSDRLAYKTVKSQSIQSIIRQFEDGLNRGYRSFFFVGRDLGSYGYDTGLTLVDLLDEIIKRYPKADYTITLNNVSPNSLIELYPRMEHVLTSKKIINLGTHIQSGSNRILKLMGKKFLVDEWAEIISDIKKKYPKVKLETSIMVGFPSETYDDFEQSVNLIKNLLLDRIIIYKYEERPNLPSLKLKNPISAITKDKRYRQIEYHATLCKIKKRLRQSHIPSVSDLNLFLDVANMLSRKLFRKLLSRYY
jgi:tRNA A37 methylthiotransferase MiaB